MAVPLFNCGWDIAGRLAAILTLATLDKSDADRNAARSNPPTKSSDGRQVGHSSHSLVNACRSAIGYLPLTRRVPSTCGLENIIDTTRGQDSVILLIYVPTLMHPLIDAVLPLAYLCQYVGCERMIIGPLNSGSLPTQSACKLER